MRIGSLVFLALLALSVPGLGQQDDFQREGDAKARAKKDPLEGKAPPALDVSGWLNTGGKTIRLGDLKGKVVVLDFWGTWWGPCRRAIPHLKDLYKRYKDQGLVLIGVHTKGGGEKMAEFVKDQGIPYPVAVDRGTTTASFRVDSYPDYYLIDRAGRLRVADLANGDLDRAVKVLLAEKAEKAAPKLEDQDATKVLGDAVAGAHKSDRKVIVHVSGPGWGWCTRLEEFLEQKPVAKAMAKDYLIIKIDSRMKKGRDVIAKLRGDRRGGIPWITILDGKSKELVTSDGPKGNVGCPMRDHEIDWFMKMLGKTSKHMSEADVKTVETSLRAYAKKILGRRR